MHATLASQETAHEIHRFDVVIHFHRGLTTTATRAAQSDLVQMPLAQKHRLPL